MTENAHTCFLRQGVVRVATLGDVLRVIEVGLRDTCGAIGEMGQLLEEIISRLII